MSARQRLLVALAGVSVVAMLIAATSRLLIERRLPAAVRGLWRTDVATYQGRLVELRTRRIAFLTGDSLHPVAWYTIDRVRRSPDTRGVRYDVEYTQNGLSAGFSFIYDAGPPELLRFTNQHHLVWRRDHSGRTLLPDPF